MTRCIVTFGEQQPEPHPIQRARVNAMVSLREAAEHIGVSAMHLNEVEHCRETLNPKHMPKLEKLYRERADEKAKQERAKVLAEKRCSHCGELRSGHVETYLGPRCKTELVPTSDQGG